MKDEEAMLAQLSNCYYEAYGVVPSDRHLGYLLFRLPQHIHAEAELWGWGDTVLGDNIYLHFKANTNIYKEEN